MRRALTALSGMRHDAAPPRLNLRSLRSRVIRR
jgi:hypothetical protein